MRGRDSNPFLCKCPADTCCHQFKNWWLHLFSFPTVGKENANRVLLPALRSKMQAGSVIRFLRSKSPNRRFCRFGDYFLFSCNECALYFVFISRGVCGSQETPRGKAQPYQSKYLANSSATCMTASSANFCVQMTKIRSIFSSNHTRVTLSPSAYNCPV